MFGLVIGSIIVALLSPLGFYAEYRAVIHACKKEYPYISDSEKNRCYKHVVEEGKDIKDFDPERTKIQKMLLKARNAVVLKQDEKR